MADPLLSYCRAEEPWLLETIEALVRSESPSTDKAAVDRCGALLAARLQALGARVEPIPQEVRGAHLRAEFTAGADGTGAADAPQVMILGHFDTVWDTGQIGRMPFVEKDGRIHGPGVFDMKSGIAVAMLAVRALLHTGTPSPRVVMLWTTDEEIGSGTSRALIEAEALRSRSVLVMEPCLPGGAAKTSRKGCGDFILRVRGISAHAGIDPTKGASAIHEIAHQILALAQLQDLERGVSVNIGTVHGGSRTNVVADEAQCSVDVRVRTMADAARVEAAVRALAPRLKGTRLELEGGFDRPPLERTAGVAALYETARGVAERLGRDLPEGATGGGSDGNFTAALGVPTLDGLGPAGDGAHALHEHVLRADLSWRAAFVAALLGRLAEVK